MKHKIYVWLSVLVLGIIVLCLAVGIELAQARPSKPAGTSKIRLHRTGVIEEPASAVMIKGRVLNSNNKPAYGARIVALPVTSWSYEIRNRSKEGYFELPWSPTWIENHLPIYLLALIQDPKSQAALVKVTDPTKPVTVRLEPAVTLKGKVVDPNSQQIEDCFTAISLSTDFKCKAPIFWALRGRPWERWLSPLPYGAKYRLTIKADGFQTKQIIVDATDKSQQVINLGTIILQPQDPDKPDIIEPGPNPELAKEFHDTYRLEKHEVIKLVKPPFDLGRQEYFQIPNSFYGPLFLSLESQGAFQANLIWDGEQLKTPRSGYTNTQRPPILEYILNVTLNMSPPDYNIPKELNIRMSYGDWIVSTESPLTEKLKALEEIIYTETKRAIRFEKRKVEREVIVAKGKYEFKPHPNGLYPNHVHVTWDGTLARWDRTVNSLEDFFSYLEYYIKMKIVDETEPMENTSIRYKESKNLSRLSKSEIKNKSLRGFLFNLSLTTSLKFTVETRPVEIWFVTENKEK